VSAPTFEKRVLPEHGRPAAAFLAEAEALGRLDHPGVVRLVGARTEADGTGVIELQRLHGPTLRRRLAAPLAWDEAVTLAASAARALEAVHAAGLVHGDLKPENAIVEGHGLVLVDFGLSLPAGARWHESGAGTPAYMAPEQVRRAPVGAATDVYALGLVLYEMLAGQPAFVGSTGAQLRQRTLGSMPAPVSVARGDDDVPGAVEALVFRMIAKEPAARPSVAELLAGLAAP
jgi:serine/threonine protein kinase